MNTIYFLLKLPLILLLVSTMAGNVLADWLSDSEQQAAGVKL